ncbi:MAG TPA: GlxA family transcriptional regulator [Aliidongia sp.]|uniref:GlxA family transcriptional regulator n=1 Tax=Aliidongia sp. TaxID=1914230 RepID=UPI002DDCD4BD|nr:GlxA family transcriptional regulator [Aliidongia sp.]HEV2677584.1 GlxA family transcriptional regulator [Aliidongia sp.]
MRTIAIAIFPGVQALDVAGPLDVFAEANGFLPADAGYDITVVAAEPGPFRASNGLLMSPDRLVGASGDRYDMILVAGGPALPTNASDPRLTDWLIEATPRCGRYGSVCTGAFVLGDAGLLDGKAVTTHWQDARALAGRFPEARVDFDRIYLRDGALVTSAGVTAGIDLALALVAEDHGSAVALKVAKRLVVAAQRQGGQSQFSPYLTAPGDEASPIARVQAHVMAHVADRFTVERLAQIAGMSVRNFARVFAQETQATPAEFIERARVDAARHLLEGSELALKAVAYHSGFGSANRMRAVFAKRLGITPAQYRASFLRPLA